MNATESIRSRLPSLYRPEPGESGVVSDMLKAVGERMDTIHQLSAFVLQQHWFNFVDKRLFNPVADLVLRRGNLPLLLQSDMMVFSDPGLFLAALTAGARAIDTFIVDSLRPASSEMLDAWESGSQPSEELQRTILDNLHRIARGELYDADRFAGVILDPELVTAVTSGIGGEELTRKNRDLLLAAYPDSLEEADHDWPTIRDLARVGSLVSVPARNSPPVLRDTVESYRTRITRIVALYRNGLGTLSALRGMTEAQLPPLPEDAPEGPDRPFSVEELAPITTENYVPNPPGPPEGMVGPLMRWNLTNAALTASAPIILITGVEPGKWIGPTQRPMIEHYRTGLDPVRVAVGYDGTIAPGETLRLRPAAHRLLLVNGEVQRASSLPGENSPADPTVTNEITAPIAGAPTGCTALVHAPEGMIWSGTDTGSLHRWNGTTWTDHGAVGDRINQLLIYNDTLLIAASNGLHSFDLATSGPPTAVSGLPAGSVNRVYRADDGQWWYATNSGIHRNASIGDAVVNVRTDGGYAWIGADNAGAMLLGSGDGLLHYDPVNDVAHRYRGIEFSETESDWEPADSAPTEIGLPGVLCARRDRTGTLWIGTESGLAAYVAEPVRTAVYHTHLRAWPDLVDTAVFSIEEDERGIIWFATGRGLLRFDGRDMHHLETAGWISYRGGDKRADGSPRGAWRYNRDDGIWQYYEESQREWRDNDLAVRTSAETPVAALLWFDGVSGDIGTQSGDGFLPTATVPDNALFVRYKSSEETIRDGGIPFIPRIPPGTSTWRYLRREDSPLTPPVQRPWWSCEGRLFPPPPIEPTPPPGRFGKEESPPPANNYDESLFAYDAEAEVAFQWTPSRSLTVLVRLTRRAGEESIDPAILDVVWNGMQKVRPAGVRTVLAVNENIVRT